MTTFFTADTHFSHANIIRFCGRPFFTAEEMDEVLIRNWNARVAENDDVWHLGDFAAARDGRCAAIWWRLNGRKHLILGNHDEENSAVLELPWVEPPDEFRMITCDGQSVFLCHYPLRVWPGLGKGAIHLFGHMHGRLAGAGQSVDVGVDAWGFRPVTLAEINARLRKQAKPLEGSGREARLPQDRLDALAARFDKELSRHPDPQTRRRIDQVFAAKGKVRKKPKA